MEKLDDFNKILIATAQINYMASAIHGVNVQMKMTGLAKEKVHAPGVKEKDRLLAETVKTLGEVMEDLGNYMSGADCICPIDVRVTTPAFEIIIHGKDDVEKDYQLEETE